MTDVVVELVSVNCGKEGCYITFGMTRTHYTQVKRTHETWYCPNGHPRFFSGASDLEEAQSKAKYWRERSESEAKMRISAERRTLAYQGHLGKLKKRIANGVCPCCKRTFGNLARHVKTQHPDYAGPEFVMPRPDEEAPVTTKRKARVNA